MLVQHKVSDVLQLAGEEVEQEAVAPGAVRVEPVLAHDPDPPEADLLVAADRALVVGCGVDREPVVAAVRDQRATSGSDPSSTIRGTSASDRGRRLTLSPCSSMTVLLHPGGLPLLG